MTSVFSDSLAGWWPKWQRLGLALGLSLALHLGGLAALRCVVGAAADVASPSAAGRAATAISAVLLAPLQEPGREGPQPASEAPAGRAAEEVRAAGAAPGSGAGSAGSESGASADASKAPSPSPSPPLLSAERLAARGQRLLAASMPPYLVQPLPAELSAGLWYFRRSELTVAAVPLDEPAIEPPDDSAGHALRGGKVVLRVFLAADGAVDRVEVASSNLPPAYDEAAVAAFSRLRFRPGEIQGVAVSSESRFEVGFDAGDPGSSHASDRRGLSPATRGAAQR
ncbi:TonB family protein [Candidatus Accumulibacter phosphatis]|uniref:TonB family protein n=1 Tax=Candidatus Accumulibacter phosphatis TaxID=327160 RepID=A0ABX1TTD5_9PROT|nr:TonB family protein [Candidatus Accumulibacter phosphatis]NMQ27465.1 TonB family protein [Candidatus Accumulibacter phosphatis]